MAGEIKSFFLEGPVGRLEALLNTGDAAASHVALVCHPHPLHGGTMHNKVVFHAMKALNGFGFPVLRFNFRGAGASAGKHDEGRGEVEDVRAALDWLANEFKLPIIFTGFSFGAAVGLRAACPHASVDSLISLGTPAQVDGRLYGYDFLATCGKPKLFVSGAEDEFASPERLRSLVEGVAPPKKLILIAGGDHFFAGHLDALQATITDWVREQKLV